MTAGHGAPGRSVSVLEQRLLQPLLRRLPGRMKWKAWSVHERWLGASPQPVTVGPGRGLTLVAPLRCACFCDGTYEPHVLSAIAGVVKPGMVACDVGSYVGHYMLALTQLVGPTGRVYAFEPLPQHVALLQRTVAYNRLQQVAIVPLAVAAESGPGMLEEWKPDIMSRLGTAGELAPWVNGSMPVRMTSLDDWAMQTADLHRLDLIKLDIEGQELAALQGAQRLLERHRPFVLCEIHRGDDVPYRPHELIVWLQKAGYTVEPLVSAWTPYPTLAALIAHLEMARIPPAVKMTAHILATPQP